MGLRRGEAGLSYDAKLGIFRINDTVSQGRYSGIQKGDGEGIGRGSLPIRKLWVHLANQKNRYVQRCRWRRSKRVAIPILVLKFQHPL